MTALQQIDELIAELFAQLDVQRHHPDVVTRDTLQFDRVFVGYEDW